MMKGTANIVRYEKVVEMRDVQGKTLQEIADYYDVSRQRIFQIYQRAVRRLPATRQNSGHRRIMNRAA